MRRTHIVILAVVVLAFALRLVALDLRPPHHDEGVNGWFVEQMLRDGYYRYDPQHYHGPLHFYVLYAARCLGGFGVETLRLPIALVGAAACLLPLLVRRRLGRTGAIAACAVLACSPSLVYYARYAIHETLLVAFTLLVTCCLLCWFDSRRPGWLVGAAAAFAGMVATKETTVIFAAVAGPWLVAELWAVRRTLAWSWRMPLVGLAMIGVFAVIHVTLFTGFFRSPDGIATSLARSAESYFLWQRASTEQAGHAKAWWYYLHLGLRYELVLYLLAILGAIAGRRVRAIRACAVLGFGMLVVYSAIAYKTPWLPMSWLALLAIPAGRGVAVIVQWLRRRHVVAIALAIPALAITIRSSFAHPADRDEALAYVHTAPDYARWFPLIEAAADVVGRRRLTVAVDHPTTWPLPWSLVPYHASWRARGTEDVMIVAASRADALERKLHEPYYRRPAELRDNAEPAFVYIRARRFATLGDKLGGMTLVAPRLL